MFRCLGLPKLNWHWGITFPAPPPFSPSPPLPNYMHHIHVFTVYPPLKVSHTSWLRVMLLSTRQENVSLHRPLRHGINRYSYCRFYGAVTSSLSGKEDSITTTSGGEPVNGGISVSSVLPGEIPIVACNSTGEE